MKSVFLFFLGLTFSAIMFAVNPKSEYELTPEDYGLNYEVLEIKSEDTIMLRGWLISPDTRSKKCMVFSHNGEGNMADYLEQAAQFLGMGYNVLMYDYRGYGESTPYRLKSKFFIYNQFAKDLEAVLDWINRNRAVFSVDLYGMGIGAGLSLTTGANRREIDRIIADGAYRTFEEVKAAAKANGQTFLFPIGYDRNVMEPHYALTEKGDHLEGILFIVSKNDKLCPPEITEELAKIRKKISTVYEVDSKDNTDNYHADNTGYYDNIKAFLGS